MKKFSSGVAPDVQQMHLIKCHFHEFCALEIQMRKHFWNRVRSGGAISAEIEFFTTWCSWCRSHPILIIPPVEGQGKVGGNRNHPRSHLRNTNAFYCGQRRQPSVLSLLGTRLILDNKILLRRKSISRAQRGPLLISTLRLAKINVARLPESRVK